MITIDQLLESVDLDFEPRYITKNKDGWITIWGERPVCSTGTDAWYHNICRDLDCGYIKLSEFDNKLWTLCIYEVPRKTTGKIEKLGKLNVSGTNMTMNQSVVDRVVNVLNQVIDTVNELKENKGE